MTPSALPFRPDRRALLRSAALTPIAAVLAAGAIPAAARAQTTGFPYEVTRSDDEWRARLTDDEYFVLRDGGTEVPHSSLISFITEDGHYSCKGCGLENFDSRWKTIHTDIGWTFFSQARPTTILTSIDEKFSGMEAGKAVIECHCRRCGSHLGHILTVKGTAMHCLNGISLQFHAA